MSERDSTSRRSFLKATGAAAAVTAMAGCGGDGDGDGDGTTTAPPTTSPPGTTTEPPTTQGPEMGGTLNLINATMRGFDPVSTANTASGVVQAQVLENLLTYPDGEAAVEQRLATDYQVSDDGLTYTFTLKEGVTFHNGDDLTASDFVYSWERLAASPHTIRAGFLLDTLNVGHETDDEGNYVEDSLDVEAVDATTFRFTQTEQFASTMEMLAYTSFAAVPEGIVGAPSDEGTVDSPSDQYQEFDNNPVGTGPFAFENWTQGESASVTAYDDYHMENRPYLDDIDWVVIEESEPAYQTSVNGNVDFLSIPDSKYDPELRTIDNEEGGRAYGTYGPLSSGDRSGETVNWYRTNSALTYYIAFDVSNTPLAVRQAAAYATDQPAFNESIFKGRDAPAYALTPPTIFPGGADGYEQFVDDHYPYGRNADIEGAKQVMEDAGYGPDNQYDLTINSYNATSFNQMAQELADRLGSAHVNIDVVPTDFSQIIQKGMDGSLQVYTLGWIADWPAPDNFLQLLYPPNTDVAELGPSAMTYTNWSELDTEASQNATEAYETVLENSGPSDEAEATRNEAYKTMEQAIWADVPIINIIHGNIERFYWDSVHVNDFGTMGPSRQTHDTTWKEQ